MKKILVFAVAALAAISVSAQTKIGHVNFTELYQLMPEADEARATMQAASKEAEETIQGMAEELQTKYQQYQQKSSSWTAAIKEAKEQELNDINNRIQQFQQTVQQELQQQQNQLMNPIIAKAQEAVKKLAKEKGITAVFDSGSAIYFDEAQTIDLTKEARTALGIKEGRTLETLQQELAASAQTEQK